MPGGGCRAVVAASSQTAAKAAKKKRLAEQARKSAERKSAESSDEEAPSMEDEGPAEPEKKKSLLRRVVGSIMDFLDQTWLQALQYILFLFTFQSLVGTLRKPEEFYLDKFISDTFIANTFDSNHNTLASIRRVADIWEWTNTVITPGLFSNADAGEWWPDGDGSFHLEGATPLSTADIVDDQNTFDFTRGIVFKQVPQRLRPPVAAPRPLHALASQSRSSACAQARRGGAIGSGAHVRSGQSARATAARARRARRARRWPGRNSRCGELSPPPPPRARARARVRPSVHSQHTLGATHPRAHGPTHPLTAQLLSAVRVAGASQRAGRPGVLRRPRLLRRPLGSREPWQQDGLRVRRGGRALQVLDDGGPRRLHSRRLVSQPHLAAHVQRGRLHRHLHAILLFGAAPRPGGHQGCAARRPGCGAGLDGPPTTTPCLALTRAHSRSLAAAQPRSPAAQLAPAVCRRSLAPAPRVPSLRPTDEVIDYRHTEARLENGVAPTYWCARYTTNGYHYVQKCNPDPGANTMVVRQMFTDMVDYLKKGHWIDAQTRMVTLSMQIRNNNAGVKYICRLMFEVTQMAAVLPSFDMEAMVDDPESFEQMKLFMFMALVLTGYFMFLEGIEMAGSGPAEYFSNIWNVLDWANFVLFFQVYQNLQSVLSLDERDVLRRGYTGAQPDGTPNDCASKICNEFGYYDMWEVSNTSRDAKFYMSICVCIQLLKIIKFTNVIVPKMSLMTSVLSKGCYDLLFFGIIFSLSMFAFCMLFYIQLGSFMDDFYSQPSSLIALAKALFGDFPFEEIMDNSRGYTNGILFLVYLFVAVFILLSMFLAILGEAQAAVREEEQQMREEGKAENPYGMLGEAKDKIGAFFAKIKAKASRNKGGGGDDDDGAGDKGDDESEGDPFEMAMQTAMTKLQAKLDSSLKQRMSGLEVRLLKELGRMEAKLREEPTAATPSKGGGGFGGGSAPRAKASAAAELKGSKSANGKSGSTTASGGDGKTSSASKVAREPSRTKAGSGGERKDKDAGKVSDVGSDTEGEGEAGAKKKSTASGDKTRARGDRPARAASTSPAPGAKGEGGGGEKEGKGSGEKEKRKKLNVAKGDLTVSPPASPKANPADKLSA